MNDFEIVMSGVSQTLANDFCDWCRRTQKVPATSVQVFTEEQAQTYGLKNPGQYWAVGIEKENGWFKYDTGFAVKAHAFLAGYVIGKERAQIDRAQMDAITEKKES